MVKMKDPPHIDEGCIHVFYHTEKITIYFCLRKHNKYIHTKRALFLKKKTEYDNEDIWILMIINRRC